MHEREQTRIFDDWLAKHTGLFFKVVHAFASTASDRDDLFQEITLGVWQSIPNFRGESSVSTWIYRVALYAAIAWSRNEKKHRTRLEPLDSMETMLSEKPQERDPRLDWVYERISQLDEIDRSVTLLMLEGCSYRDIGSVLGISENHVAVKLNRIKAQLNKQLRKEQQYGV